MYQSILDNKNVLKKKKKDRILVRVTAGVAEISGTAKPLGLKVESKISLVNLTQPVLTSG